ncbi:hypothetical protein L6452_03210 [Arctium lappa]|uniref:Uncharacterized protein n=1 Tax=Arctium lappa TaxID=4217 RepID=A0ACB9FMI7_ARCLA|nr:hypothetical protein L6452_03210 [Arctium lappa]
MFLALSSQVDWKIRLGFLSGFKSPTPSPGKATVDSESVLLSVGLSPFNIFSDLEEVGRAMKLLGMKLEWTYGVKTVMRTIHAIKYMTKHENAKSGVAAYTGWEDARNDPVKVVTFRDDTPLTAHVIYECLKILDEESVAIPCQQGDVLLLDNLAVLHARQLFELPRRVLASLCK